jgi:hypothetical protein
MIVSDLLELLSQGEMRQMAMAGAEYSGILDADLHKVIPHINLGLTELHKRFLLKTDQVTIQQYSHIERYYLHPNFAQSNTVSIENYKYIKDSIFQPFNDSSVVLGIEQVFKEDGSEYIMNDDTNPYSIFTPAYNCVQIPYSDDDNSMTVVYRANHKKLVSTGVLVREQEIDISPTYLEALLLYVGGRFLTSIGHNDASAEGNNLIMRFEMSCSKIQELGLTITENTSNQKLDMNGWA